MIKVLVITNFIVIFLLAMNILVVVLAMKRIKERKKLEKEKSNMYDQYKKMGGSK